MVFIWLWLFLKQVFKERNMQWPSHEFIKNKELKYYLFIISLISDQDKSSWILAGEKKRKDQRKVSVSQEEPDI